MLHAQLRAVGAFHSDLFVRSEFKCDGALINYVSCGSDVSLTSYSSALCLVFKLNNVSDWMTLCELPQFRVFRERVLLCFSY